MTRHMLPPVVVSTAIAAIFALPQQTACGRSPDQVRHSPIPPIPASAKAKTNPKPVKQARVIRLTPVSLVLHKGSPAAHNFTGNIDGANQNDYRTQADLWDSASMQQARASIRSFARASAQTSADEAEKFIDRLAELNPEDLDKWLERYEIRRDSIAHSQRTSARARRARIEKNIYQPVANRQRAEYLAELHHQVSPITIAQEEARIRIASKPFSELGTASSLNYDPLELVFDPSSPRGTVRLFAAAVSLPGDLPASDPANFIEPAEVE